MSCCACCGGVPATLMWRDPTSWANPPSWSCNPLPKQPTTLRPEGFMPSLEKFADAEASFSVPALPCDMTGKAVASLAVSFAPSGPGELLIDSVAYSGNQVTFRCAAGQPRRTYTLKFLIGFSDGSVSEQLCLLTVLPMLASDFPAPAASPGFSTWIEMGVGVYDISTYDSGAVYAAEWTPPGPLPLAGRAISAQRRAALVRLAHARAAFRRAREG